MHSQTIQSTCRKFALACVALAPAAPAARLAAQDAPPPPAQTQSPQAQSPDQSPAQGPAQGPGQGPAAPAAGAAPGAQYNPGVYASRWDIFAGYSYLAPKGTVNVLQPDGVTTLPYDFSAVDVGGLGSVAFYFNKFIGLQGEFGYHEWGDSRPGTNIGVHGNNDGFLTGGGGLIARFPTNEITPFIHALAIGARIDGPDHNPYTWGPGGTVGGGLDYSTPWHFLAIRIFQADYQYMHADFGRGVFGGRANINAARLSAGLVFRGGSIEPPNPPSMSCAVNPASVFPGDPITVTATATNLNPKWNTIYNWSGDGVTGTTGPTASISTGALNPGTYTVKGELREGRQGREGEKPWQVANCSASFTVKPFEPPTMGSCSASPTTIRPGDTATITASATSPQNRPLTYTYSAQSGTVSGTGTTATFNSAGAPTGTVEITCAVADDKNHSVSSTTTVTIVAPPPPPQPHVQPLCTLGFDNDHARPTRVDNEAKACLDEVALALQQQSDAKLVIVGTSTEQEKASTERQRRIAERHPRARVLEFAAQRAANSKDYLVTEKGIDASRVSLATGTEDSQKTANFLVPSGANFGADVQGTTPVDESTIKPETRKPLPERHHGHAHAHGGTAAHPQHQQQPQQPQQPQQ